MMVLGSMAATIAQTSASLTKHQAIAINKPEDQKSGERIFKRNSSVGKMRFLRSLRALRVLRLTRIWGGSVKENYETEVLKKL